MSVEELRKQNIDEAKRIFDDFAVIMENIMPMWVWQKKKVERTKFVLSVMSFLRFFRGEYVYFNPKYLKDAMDIWKDLAENHPEVAKWIKIYEERFKLKGKIGEIGERVVDLSSSSYPVPICLSMALEYESAPDWGNIMGDFRKLLSVLANVKVGIFHLPPWWSTSRVWLQNEETGEIKWVDAVLDSDKLDQFVEDIAGEIKRNALEHAHTVYLIMFVRARAEEMEVNLCGYLFWREPSGEVRREMLDTRTSKSKHAR